MRFNYRLLVLSALQLFLAHQVLADNAVVEEQISMPVQVGNRTEMLDTLIVHPVGGVNLPIALIVNGAESGPEAKSARADWLAHIAHDFAHRGWLAASVEWPGYGRSSPSFMENTGKCSSPTMGPFLNSHADVLASALAALRARTDVDPSTALGVGISIGGASMLTLAGRSGRPLKAVINISGGVFHANNAGDPESNCGLSQDDLLRNLTRSGAGNPTPTLWIYAKNDPYFPPEFAHRMLAAYLSKGGLADFNMLAPFGSNGHTLFKSTATPFFQPQIEAFLQRGNLPALDQSSFAPLLSRLQPIQRKTVENYLRQSTEKALASTPNSDDFYWHFGERSAEDARKKALSDCHRATGEQCHIVAENDHLIDSEATASVDK